MSFNYTNEKNIQMLIYLLKANNIKKIIINPGTMNMSFVASIQSDPFFELFSCVDERSACYMACGLAAESLEPVVLTCTGATASRNYMPGLTEAFYRKLPILTVTCTSHLGNIGQNIPQVLDRRTQLNDTYLMSVYISPIKSIEDEWSDNLLLNEAILELTHNGGGPVHINLGTEVTKIFDCLELPKFRKISRIQLNDNIPKITSDTKLAIFVGNHEPWSQELIVAVEKFCELYNAVVLCDHTSNYFGKYKIMMNIISDQDCYQSPNNNFDLLIHIGNTSGSYMKLNTKGVWRVNPDGKIRDTFKKLVNVFEMSELCFFELYNSLKNETTELSLFNSLQKERLDLEEKVKLCELPFSNLWVAQNTIKFLPGNAVVHLGILNSLRSWNYFELQKDIKCYCNTGGFGIDGVLSTVIGASLNDNGSKNYFCVLGDLAFFYDMNSLGNRSVPNNLRILLINNGCGTEFHNYSHPANCLGQESISKFIAADGHFGSKSNKLVKSYAENLGFEYINASNKEEYLKKLDYFTSEKIHSKPIIFEVFTNSDDESLALHKIRNLKASLNSTLKNKVKKALSPNVKNKIKKIIKK